MGWGGVVEWDSHWYLTLPLGNGDAHNTVETLPTQRFLPLVFFPRNGRSENDRLLLGLRVRKAQRARATTPRMHKRFPVTRWTTFGMQSNYSWAEARIINGFISFRCSWKRGLETIQSIWRRKVRFPLILLRWSHNKSLCEGCHQTGSGDEWTADESLGSDYSPPFSLAVNSLAQINVPEFLALLHLLFLQFFCRFLLEECWWQSQVTRRNILPTFERNVFK